MYIYFLLFQDTGGKDDCDCKIKDDIFKPSRVWRVWLILCPVDDQYEEGLCYCIILLSLERNVKSLDDC